MAISNQATYEQLRDFPRERNQFSKSAVTTISGRPYSTWLAAGFPAAGVAPTTAAVPTNATTGSLGQTATGLSQRILKAILELGVTSGGGMVTIVDRVAHSGGLSGIVTGAQTTNLPTPSLTRFTSGVGVELGLEFYTAAGATGTTVTASYSNTAPASGQATPAMTFGGTGFNAISRVIFMPLASGDVGVTAVASINIVATTGTAGNLGISLMYPLASIAIDHMLPFPDEAEALYGFGPWFPQFADQACLSFIVHTNGTSTGVMQGVLNLAEDA